LREQDVGILEDTGRIFHVLRGQACVGTKSHNDGVLARLTHPYHRHARSSLSITRDCSHPYPLGSEPFNRSFPERVYADVRDECDGSSKAPGSHRLIRAFPAGMNLEVKTQQSLTGTGQFGNADNKVGIGTAHDYDLRTGVLHGSGTPKTKGGGICTNAVSR